MWITETSIHKPVFATMVMVAVCVFGMFSYARLGVEQMPDVSMPLASVQVSYPGASPEAVEREVTRPLEESLNGIAGVRHITSSSFEGRSQVSVEFGLDADMARAMQEVRDRVAAARAGLPDDANTPTITRAGGDDAQPVAVLSLLSKTRSARDLSILADLTVRRRLQRTEGVARVTMDGMTRRELRLDLDAARLRANNITPAEILSALREANNDRPVGRVSDATQDALLRVEGRARNPGQLADLVVARRGGLPLTLRDLGTLVEREKETDTLARVNGRPAVNFSVFKQQEANMVATGEAVKAALEELRLSLPADTELQLVHASSDFIKNSLAGLQRTMIEGALLTVGIVFLFLRSWRSMVITGLTLPIAVIASFIAMRAFGFSVNFMTIMALSLCIGLLIDDAIVVRENIVRHLRMGKDHHAAALDGTREIGLAVMATTFAICAVFVPVAFMGGLVGKFFYHFGITVTAAVLASLFISFTLDPMLSSVWRDPPRNRMAKLPVLGRMTRATDHGLDALQAAYKRLILWVFSDRRYHLLVMAITPRALVLAAGAASFVVALMLVPLVGSEFIPQTDDGLIRLSIRATAGASLERTDDKVRQVEEIISSFPEVKTLAAIVGASGNAASAGRNHAVLNVVLVDRGKRSRSQRRVEEAIRARIAKIPGIEVSVGVVRPIQVSLLGTDTEALARAATDFAERLKKLPGIADVDLSIKPGLPAFAVRLKPGAVRELGMTASQLAASLRTYVEGDVATHWTAADGEQVDVLLRLPEAQRRHVEQMRQLPIAFSKEGIPITLDSVATIEPVANPEVIRRLDLQRSETISASVQGRPAGDVGDDLRNLVRDTRLPQGVKFNIGGDTKEQQEAFAAMVGALALAVIFIYIVLASQFGSFLQPIAIMASLPLSLVGVMVALLLCGSTLNVLSMIGLVMLMGLVTKNAILLVDFANRARDAGATVADALLQAGLIRMRPIVMTTAAMIFGMLPMALALNEGGEIQASMGRAIIGGVLTSSLLTLVVVPVLYSYLVRERKGTSREVRPVR